MDRTKSELEKAISFFERDGCYVLKFSYKGKLYYQVSTCKLNVICKPDKPSFLLTDRLYYFNNNDWYCFYTPRQLIKSYKDCRGNKYNSIIKEERKVFNRSVTKQKLIHGEDESLHKNKLAKDSNLWYYD